MKCPNCGFDNDYPFSKCFNCSHDLIWTKKEIAKNFAVKIITAAITAFITTVIVKRFIL